MIFKCVKLFITEKAEICSPAQIHPPLPNEHSDQEKNDKFNFDL